LFLPHFDVIGDPLLNRRTATWKLFVKYQALHRYFNTIPGEIPENMEVLKAAPTGKAAFHIKGNTLYSAFKIPVNRVHCILDRDRLSTIRTQLRKLQVIFIDEISMVGSGMFNFLNLRLQQITDT